MTSQTEEDEPSVTSQNDAVTSHKDIVTSDEEEEVLYEGREATKVGIIEND